MSIKHLKGVLVLTCFNLGHSCIKDKSKTAVTQRLQAFVYSCAVISSKILQAFLVLDLAAILFSFKCILVTLNIMLK